MLLDDTILPQICDIDRATDQIGMSRLREFPRASIAPALTPLCVTPGHSHEFFSRDG